jgi:hypothetical protein
MKSEFRKEVTVKRDFDENGAADLGVYDIDGGVWFIRRLDGTVLVYGSEW